jgi:LmbE family N-acetylglucosaminyl deacetylase
VISTVPFGIPEPRRLLLVSPHPDDVGISAGALAITAARAPIPTTIVLATDGSEASMPWTVLARHGGHESMSGEAQRALRGSIRVRESRAEAVRLGLGESSVRLLASQRWFTAHRTPNEFLYPDLSLRSVGGFQPGPVEEDALAEFRSLIEDGPVLCAVPEPRDKLLMHRIVTALVREALKPFDGCRLITYECLSTEEWSAPVTTYLGFGEEVMRIKREAIRAHQSMYERRREFGGYANAGGEAYDSIAARGNAELAAQAGLSFPYAERYGLHFDP